MEMSSVYIIFNQLLFFGMCDIALCNYEANKKTTLVGLNSLLLYYVITYFVKRIIDIVQRIKSESTSTTHRSFNSLFLCILKIILEWAKAVVAIICLREQGLKPHPHLLYTIMTSLYYFSTEPTYANILPDLLKLFNCQNLEGMESFYTPVVLNSFTILCSIVLMPVVAFYHFYFAIICFYHTIYLKSTYLWRTYWLPLQEENIIMADFPIASPMDIEAWNDICAVCLNNITHARKTQCGHLFHRECLRSCLKTSNHCPLCKTYIANNIT